MSIEIIPELNEGQKNTLADYDRRIEEASSGNTSWKYWDLRMKRTDFLRQVREGII